MKAYLNFYIHIAALSTITLCVEPVNAKNSPILINAHTLQNNIPPRFKWNSNDGYCGEVSLISAGLYYGQYISQYDARAIAIKDQPQDTGELLLGKNDAYTAAQIHLQGVEWNTTEEQNSKQFLSWVKENVVKGYPVAIGVFTNEYIF